jgi:hypothetical protein
MRTRSLIPAALLLFGCSLRHAPVVAPAPARGPARDSLFQLDEIRGDSVAAHGPVDGVLALLAPDVVYLRAGAPATYGRDAARALLLATTPTSADLPRVESWEPLGGGVSNDLRSAYTFGITARAAPPRREIHFERYVAFWQRVRGQPWRIVAYAEVGGQPPSTRAEELSLSVADTTPPVPDLPKPLALARDGLRAADSLFSDLAYRMGVGYAFANTITAEGVVFGEPQLVIGPKAVGDYYDARRDGTSLTWRPVYAVVAGSMDLGFTVGEYIATGRGPSGAAVQRFGKYLTVWRRERDGTWKFVADGGNPTR